MRGALPGFRGVLGERALFDLAARADVESRLVERRGARWKVSEGPFGRGRPARAAGRDWTLLVSGVNHHCAAAERLLRRFAFVPEARLDDLMVSYAAPGGGVGPHFDSYDVFLVQGPGRRVWRLARARPWRLVPGAPLRLIAGFSPEEELLLEPGDLLYLPPGWGHDGVALEPAFTCSVGFRAPRGEELGAAFLDYLHERGLPAAAYRDPGLAPSARRGAIGDGLARFAARTLARIRWGRADVERFLGRYLTTPKPQVVFARRAAGRAPPLARREAVLDARTRMLYRGRRVFVNGEAIELRAAQRAALRRLADRRRAPGQSLARAGLAALVYAWWRDGALRLERATATHER